MATEMPSKENNESRDDGYDIDYYEKEGNESNMRNLKEMLDDARRETHNVKMKLNSFAKYSMLGLTFLIVLILVLLSLEVVTITAGAGGGGGGGGEGGQGGGAGGGGGGGEGEGKPAERHLHERGIKSPCIKNVKLVK